MRILLPVLLAAPLLCGSAVAAADDAQMLDDLTVVTATPRPTDVKMVVQTAGPGRTAPDQVKKVELPAETPATVKTASK